MVGGATVTAATYLSYNYLENTTGGAISQWFEKRAFDAFKAAYENGKITRENIEDSLNTALSLTEFIDSSNATLKNTSAFSALYGKDTLTAEDVKRAQTAVLATMLTPDSVVPLIARTTLREMTVDRLYPDQQEADTYLARNLVNDIVESGRSNALREKGAEITEDDVVTYLNKEYQNDNRAITFLMESSPRILAGLRLAYPNLFQERPQLDSDARAAAEMSHSDLVARMSPLELSNAWKTLGARIKEDPSAIGTMARLQYCATKFALSMLQLGGNEGDKDNMLTRTLQRSVLARSEGWFANSADDRFDMASGPAPAPGMAPPGMPAPAA